MHVTIKLDMDEFRDVLTGVWDQFDIPDDYELSFILTNAGDTRVDGVVIKWDTNVILGDRDDIDDEMD